jgi:pilus assembly protein CpaF
MGMESLNDMFFTSAGKETLTYDQILEDVQKYCTDKLTTEGNRDEARKLLREFISQYIISRSYHIEGLTTEELCDTIYEDMAGISFLKKWIYMPGVEEVNVNAFDDIEVIMSGGRSMKIPDRFQSPQHAIDVTRRLLNTCGMVIDDTMPSVIGFLDKNIRISVDKTPIVDSEVGINASIRIVNQQTVSRDKLIRSSSATDEMLDLLTCCIRYGVSTCISGSTGSGKTTVMSWLLSMVPDNRRLITIEEGSREFDLIKRDKDGHAINSVVHLLTRPHENPSLDIDQDLLLERVLRKHPDVIGVGEMRSAKEALSVAESSRTGHTVVTTIHSNSAESTYRRMMTLAKRKYNIADEILMQIMVEAYPIVVYTKQLEDGSRKIMEIIEGEDYRNGQLIYHPLYQYDVSDNRTNENGKITVVGNHKRLGSISDTLKKRMLDNGIPAGKLAAFLTIPAQNKTQKGRIQNAMDTDHHLPAGR